MGEAATSSRSSLRPGGGDGQQAPAAIPLNAAGEETVLSEPTSSGFEASSDEDDGRDGGSGAMERGLIEPGLIEPGRALALADFSPPSLSAGERLIRFAYGLGRGPAIAPAWVKVAA